MGNLPQPYITEVYADYDPGVGDSVSGYTHRHRGVEPYPYNIQLNGLGHACHRSTDGTGASAALTLDGDSYDLHNAWNTKLGPIIAGQRLRGVCQYRHLLGEIRHSTHGNRG